MAIIEFKNVNKKYNAKSEEKAVKDFNLKIKDNQLCIFVGPSGCGKSTVLRMIAGLEDISEGEILIDDVLINDKAPKDRDVAMVFQNYALYPHMTVYENMAFGLKIRKTPKEKIKQLVEEASQILGIENLLDRKPEALSGGQRQRVAVGRAIVRNPKLFLFDEPLSNLDAKLKIQMRAEIAKLHQKLKVTMIYVTHDQTIAMSIADVIVTMNDGKIQQVDTPMNLYQNPVNQFVAGFIGTPTMNFIKLQIHKKKNEISLSNKNKTIHIDLNKESTEKMRGYGKDEVILGVRPEDVHAKTKDLAKKPAHFKSKIEVVELLGTLMNVYFKGIDGGGEDAVVCQTSISYSDELIVEREIEVFFDLDKIKLFDIDSKETI